MPIGDVLTDDLLRARTALFEALLDALPISDDCSWRLVDALDAYVRAHLYAREKAYVRAPGYEIEKGREAADV